MQCTDSLNPSNGPEGCGSQEVEGSADETAGGDLSKTGWGNGRFCTSTFGTAFGVKMLHMQR